VGVVAAAGTAFVGTLLLRLTAAAPDAYDIGDRLLTAVISRPDALAAVVSVFAGVIGMLSLTEGRSDALIGVLVSMTTIPAIGTSAPPPTAPEATSAARRFSWPST
jgi:hypothetical protein